MEKFEVQQKHLTGKISNFPLRVVQLMVDEQVRQGNKPNPEVFAKNLHACKAMGGFTWEATHLGHNVWNSVIMHNRFGIITKPEKPKAHPHAKLMVQYAKDAATSATPWDKWEFCVENEKKWRTLDTHPLWGEATQYRRKTDNNDSKQLSPDEIIRDLLDKGIQVWAIVSDTSYEAIRESEVRCVQCVIGYDSSSDYPVRTTTGGFKYAIPINLFTMTEIVGLPDDLR